VIVTGDSPVKDLEEYFASRGAERIEVDRLGDEYHLIVDLGATENTQGDDTI
jgi:hypothetical protein